MSFFDLAAPLTTLPHASFSRLKDYEECAHRVKLLLIDKAPRETSEHAERGLLWHKMIELYLRQESDELPEMAYAREKIDLFRYLNGLETEKQYAFDEEWRITDWKRAAFRVIADWQFEQDPETIYIGDWKTGKPKPLPHSDQVMCTAFLSFLRYPHIQKAVTHLAYLDHDRDDIRTYTRAELHPYAERLKSRVRIMLGDSILPARPAKWKCGWCGVRKHCIYRWEE